MNTKRTYETPKIVHTEKLTSRAINCGKADDSCASGGAIQS